MNETRRKDTGLAHVKGRLWKRSSKYKVLEAEPSKKARPSREGQDEERQGHVHKDFVRLS